MKLHAIGIDLGKTVFHLVGLSPSGEVMARKKFSRTQLLRFTANMQAALIGMEACAGSHFLGKALREQGHAVRLMPGTVREAIREDQQERFHRCGSHRRGSEPAFDALCADQD